jgi:hypothetical protein
MFALLILSGGGSTGATLGAATAGAAVSSPSAFVGAKRALISTLREEYGSMFAPMRTEFYTPDVSFKDPLISIGGVSAYQSNVDLLGGRNALGAFLFKGASIKLHDVVEDPDDPLKLTTRWTLQLCMKVLPWQPYARFTGVSKYTLNENAIVVGQQDYWDSINLDGGAYSTRSPLDALADFAAQLSVNAGPELLPYTLLRRGAAYAVHRYAGAPARRLIAMDGATRDAPATLAVAPLAPNADTASAGAAAAAVRAAAERDGLRTLPGHWVAYPAPGSASGSGDEVWVALANSAADIWPVDSL